MLGESGVGKTTMMFKYIYGLNLSSTITTVGLDFHIKNVEYNDNIIKAIIWDTGGLERFRTINRSYIMDVDVAILVYDINDHLSMNQIDYWAEFVKEESPNTKMIIVGNKVDLKRNVKYEEGKNIAEKYDCLFFECSSKLSNLDFVFDEAIKIISQKKIKKINSRKSDNIVKLSIETPIEKKQRCGCV